MVHPELVEGNPSPAAFIFELKINYPSWTVRTFCSFVVKLKNMKPFSDNIIFLDTEFSSLDPYKGEILSIGLVKMNGEELYLELEYDGEVDEWVKENVIPILRETRVGREEVVRQIKNFVGNTKPYVVGYVNQFDSVYWSKLYKSSGIKENPF